MPITNLGNVLKFVAHGKRVQSIAHEFGWRPGARYTNLRDIRDAKFDGRGFLDINWKAYNFVQHLNAAKASKPFMTVARDVDHFEQLSSILDEAEKLQEHATYVVIVPKDPALIGKIERVIPKHYILGFSVPTRYGATTIPPTEFKRPVHLLGGRPDVQRKLADCMEVFSVDCNRFTLDAAYGDYFDGETFRPHPVGGYLRCLRDSILNINSL